MKKLIDQEVDKVPAFRESLDRYGALAERQKELEFLQSKNLTNIREQLSPTAIENLIRETKRADVLPGVLGRGQKAKAVSDETLAKLEKLRDDLRVSMDASIPTSLKSEPVESGGNSHGLLGHLSVMTGLAGSGGALAGHLIAPGLGVSEGVAGIGGFLAGAAAQKIGQRVSNAASKVDRKATLEVMLHPHVYGPKLPKPPEMAKGVYSGITGGNALNGLTAAQPQQGENQ